MTEGFTKPACRFSAPSYGTDLIGDKAPQTTDPLSRLSVQPSTKSGESVFVTAHKYQANDVGAECKMLTDEAIPPLFRSITL